VTAYRRFLGAVNRAVLPYFGGPFVDAPDRRLRLEGEAEPGYWTFEIAGRVARPLEPAAQPDLTGLPAVRGHVVAGYLVQAGGRSDRLAFPADEEPPRFAALVGRRWPLGPILSERLEFESGAEEEARHRFEERRSLVGAKGVASSLRAAFGYAVVLRVAQERGVPVSPAEVRRDSGLLAEEGDAKASEILDRLVAERERQAFRRRIQLDPRRSMLARNPEERADAALRAAGGALLSSRQLAGGLLEVRYLLDGERFVSVVDADSFQVVDAGICLAGADRLITLDSLPLVIREAAETGQLVMTAWA
jgi:hypothetical protein